MEIRISGSFVEQSNKITALFFSLLLEKKKENPFTSREDLFCWSQKILSQFLYGSFSSFLYYLCNGYNSQITTPQASDMFHR